MERTLLKVLIFTALAMTVSTVLVPVAAPAEPLKLMRRWAVFPFETDNPSLKNAAENAWWKVRERLTTGKKYLVASRQFLIQNDVFQPRRNLDADDVKLLAHLLDADVIVTGFSENREFQLNAYLAQNGSLYWSKKLSFHPSLKASDQLELTSDKLGQELLNKVPYQGFVITDPIIGKTVYEEDSKKYVVVDTGTTEGITEGMEVQWVKTYIPDKSDKKTSGPLSNNLKVEILGDGKISKVKHGVFIAELDRAKSPNVISEQTFVVIPKLASNVTDHYLGNEIPKEKNAPELLPVMINPVAPESQGAHKHTLIFGSVLSLLGLLLLGL